MISEKELAESCENHICSCCRFEALCTEAVHYYPNSSLFESINKIIRKQKLEKLLEL